jgi:quercetin dioxygenase-like cupin family protein
LTAISGKAFENEKESQPVIASMVPIDKIPTSTTRIFNIAKFFQPTDGAPIRSVITASPEAVVVVWYIQPKQEIPAHQHPHGQDTWTILAGRGQYYLGSEASPAKHDRDNTQSISMGDVVIAPTGAVHGVFNHGDEPLIFISVVSPADAGYQLVEGRG